MKLFAYEPQISGSLKGHIVGGAGVTTCMHAGGVIVRTAAVVNVGTLGNYGSVYREARRMVVFIPLADAFYKNNDKNGNYDDKNNANQNRNYRESEIKATVKWVVKKRNVHRSYFLPIVQNNIKT